MMPTDTLTCEVTPDSVEPSSLSCSMPPLDNLELWTVLSSLVTGIATVLLAFFAFAAWRTAQLTLRSLQAQIQDTRELATESQAAAEQLANKQRLSEAYREAHADMLSVSIHLFKPAHEFRPVNIKLSRSLPPYLMALAAIDDKFAEVVKRGFTALLGAVLNFREQFALEIGSETSTPEVESALEPTKALITTFLSTLTIGQSDSEIRSFAAQEIESITSRLVSMETNDGQ